MGDRKVSEFKSDLTEGSLGGRREGKRIFFLQWEYMKTYSRIIWQLKTSFKNRLMINSVTPIFSQSTEFATSCLWAGEV